MAENRIDLSKETDLIMNHLEFMPWIDQSKKIVRFRYAHVLPNRNIENYLNSLKKDVVPEDMSIAGSITMPPTEEELNEAIQLMAIELYKAETYEEK